MYGSIKVADGSQITLTMEELDAYINQKVKEQFDTLNHSQPTGVKKTAFVGVNSSDSSVYTKKTSMSGLARTIDSNNSMLEYVSYSDENGYTVLKSRLVFY